MKNQPYIKQYDKNGVLTNPIDRLYKSGVGRRYRRRKEPRKVNNRNSFHLALFGMAKFHIRFQKVLTDSGEVKSILHYEPANARAIKSLKK